MKTQRFSQPVKLAVILSLLLLSLPLRAQEKSQEKPEGKSETKSDDSAPDQNVVEFGVRYSWGSVYGRPDLLLGPGGPSATGSPSLSPGCLGCGTAFDPLLRTSKFEEYRDLRNGAFVRKLDATFDNLLGSKNYIR